jgi:hypothetical protein
VRHRHPRDGRGPSESDLPHQSLAAMMRYGLPAALVLAALSTSARPAAIDRSKIDVVPKQQHLWEVTTMRITIALISTIVAAQLLGATEPAQAAPAQTRWCLRTDSGNSDCSFDTLKQCQASRFGLTSGSCFRARREHPGTPTAQAAPAPSAPHSWCLRTDEGNSDCSFDTVAQCRASRSGVTTGSCFRARRPHPGTPKS